MHYESLENKLQSPFKRAEFINMYLTRAIIGRVSGQIGFGGMDEVHMLFKYNGEIEETVFNILQMIIGSYVLIIFKMGLKHGAMSALWLLL